MARGPLRPRQRHPAIFQGRENMRVLAGPEDPDAAPGRSGEGYPRQLLDAALERQDRERAAVERRNDELRGSVAVHVGGGGVVERRRAERVVRITRRLMRQGEL